MALKIISLIFIVSLAFGITIPNQSKDVPFGVNEVINRVSLHHSQPNNLQALTPDLTGEFIIDTSTSLINHYSPAIAFDGSNYLVVWRDTRSVSWDIYGTRVNPAGAVLDPQGIPISTEESNQSSPSVAFDGANYLVVWLDERIFPPDIYGSRVNQFGNVLDPAGIIISDGANHQENPSITFGGTNYLVVWQDFRSGSSWDIYGSRVSQTGSVLDPLGIAIYTAAYNQESPSVAFDGTNYLVVWKDFNGSSHNIYGARVTQQGIVLDTHGFAIITGESPQMYPSVSFGDINYLVVWDDWHFFELLKDILGARVSQQGTVLNRFVIAELSQHQEYPSVAYGAYQYLVVWHDSRNTPAPVDIYGARVNLSGGILDPNGIPISTAEGVQRYSSVAFDGTNYLVVWEDYRNGLYYEIYGTRVSQSGTVLDSVGICISGIEENHFQLTYNYSSLIIYPNPAKLYCAVRLPQTMDRYDLKIFDVSGKLVKEERVTSTQEHKQEVRISLKEINPGIYFLRLGKETKKFIVTR